MDIAAAHAICAADDPVAAYAADVTLWGEMSKDERLLVALRQAFARVKDFEKARQ
jgi:D-arabinitol 4-dehydrogenase